MNLDVDSGRYAKCNPLIVIEAFTKFFLYEGTDDRVKVALGSSSLFRKYCSTGQYPLFIFCEQDHHLLLALKQVDLAIIHLSSGK